jgi:hypothetical protein
VKGPNGMGTSISMARQKQIPFGDDNQRGNDKQRGNDNDRDRIR